MRLNASVTEVARNFADYINRVAFRGERFVLMRGKKPMAELGPVPSGKRLGELPEILGSLPRLDPAEAESLAADLERDRAAIRDRSPQDPWVS
jgi:antitoxin (DNA-binding transcriptional repressor) of toxin-antitoxin stability system